MSISKDEYLSRFNRSVRVGESGHTLIMVRQGSFQVVCVWQFEQLKPNPSLAVHVVRPLV